MLRLVRYSIFILLYLYIERYYLAYEKQKLPITGFWPQNIEKKWRIFVSLGLTYIHTVYNWPILNVKKET